MSNSTPADLQGCCKNGVERARCGMDGWKVSASARGSILNRCPTAQIAHPFQTGVSSVTAHDGPWLGPSPFSGQRLAMASRFNERRCCRRSIERQPWQVDFTAHRATRRGCDVWNHSTIAWDRTVTEVGIDGPRILDRTIQKRKPRPGPGLEVRTTLCAQRAHRSNGDLLR